MQWEISIFGLFQNSIEAYPTIECAPNVPDSWSIIESGNFSHVPLMSGANKDEGLMMSLGLYLDEAKFADFSARWRQELCPLIVFHRSVKLK